MKHHTIRRIVASLPIAALVLAACGGDDDADTTTPSGPSIEVVDVWARTSPMVATAGAVYMTITNSGDTDDALIGAGVDPSIAKKVEMHETVAVPSDTSGGMGSETSTAMGGSGSEMMEMRPVDRIVAPADGFVALEPGGYHIMLLDLVQPLAVGTSIDLVLTFEHAGEMTVTAAVRDTAP
jgi:copper(I)-binding protein